MESPQTPDAGTISPLSQREIDTLSESNQDWIDEKQTSVDHEISLRRLMDEYNDEARFLVDWANRSEAHATIYRTLVFRKAGILLSDINKVVNASKSTVRRRLDELEDNGIVVRGGYPTVVSVAQPHDDLTLLLTDLHRLIG